MAGAGTVSGWATKDGQSFETWDYAGYLRHKHELEKLEAGGAEPAPPPAAAAPPATTQTAAAPAPAAPAIGGMGTDSGAMAGAPAAMSGLSSVAQGEGFREGFLREGWGDQGAPSLSIPGQRKPPASSRALAQVVSGKGRAY